MYIFTVVVRILQQFCDWDDLPWKESKWMYSRGSLIHLFPNCSVPLSPPLPSPCVIKAGRSRKEELFEVEMSSLFLSRSSAFHAYATKL